MKIRKRTEGQTLIETALILTLLLLILLGITEFARAWFTKNSLKNAVRHGARVAVVTQHISTFPSSPCPSSCPASRPTCTGSCTDANPIILHVVCCESPGVRRADTTVSLTVDMTTEPPTSSLNAGDTITVTASGAFTTIVPRILGAFIPSAFSAQASMRYE